MCLRGHALPRRKVSLHATKMELLICARACLFVRNYLVCIAALQQKPDAATLRNPIFDPMHPDKNAGPHSNRLWLPHEHPRSQESLSEWRTRIGDKHAIPPGHVETIHGIVEAAPPKEYIGTAPHEELITTIGKATANEKAQTVGRRVPAAMSRPPNVAYFFKNN